MDNLNRTRTFASQPSLNFAIAEDRTDWNTLIRFDHQINKNNTWAIWWLREWAPQWLTVPVGKNSAETTQDETDLDQTAVGTLTTVLGNSRVNTVRVARTWEHWWHGNECFRAQGPNGGREGFEFGNEPTGNQSLCPPQLNYLEYLSQASTESQGPWDSNYQVEDDYSWFMPGKHGDHDMKFGVRYNYTALRRVSQVNQNGTFTFNTNSSFDAANPKTYPERLSIRTGAFEENVKNHTYEAFAQDKWHVTPRTTINVGVRYDLEIIPLNETNNPLFSPARPRPPTRTTSRRACHLRTRWMRTASRSSAADTDLLQPDDPRGRRRHAGVRQVHVVECRHLPVEWYRRSRSERRTVPDRPAPVNGPFVNRALLDASYPPGVSVRNNGVVIFDSPNRTLPHAHQFTLGHERELRPALASHVDYVRAMNKEMFLARNLNPALRVDTSRTGALTRSDAFGVLGSPTPNRSG